MGAGKGLIIAVIAVVAIWLANGFYRVQPEEQGVQPEQLAFPQGHVTGVPLDAGEGLGSAQPLQLLLREIAPEREEVAPGPAQLGASAASPGQGCGAIVGGGRSHGMKGRLRSSTRAGGGPACR